MLEPAALPYALVAFTDAPGAQGEFVVTVESGEVVTFEAMPPLVTAEEEARRLAARYATLTPLMGLLLTPPSPPFSLP